MILRTAIRLTATLCAVRLSVVPAPDAIGAADAVLGAYDASHRAAAASEGDTLTITAHALSLTPSENLIYVGGQPCTALSASSDASYSPSSCPVTSCTGELQTRVVVTCRLRLALVEHRARDEDDHGLRPEHEAHREHRVGKVRGRLEPLEAERHGRRYGRQDG